MRLEWPCIHCQPLARLRLFPAGDIRKRSGIDDVLPDVPRSFDIQDDSIQGAGGDDGLDDTWRMGHCITVSTAPTFAGCRYVHIQHPQPLH